MPPAPRASSAESLGDLVPGPAAVLVEAVAEMRAGVPRAAMALEVARRAPCAARVRNVYIGWLNARSTIDPLGPDLDRPG